MTPQTLATLSTTFSASVLTGAVLMGGVIIGVGVVLFIVDLMRGEIV